MAATREKTDPRVVLAVVAGLCFLGVLVLRLWLKWVGPLPGDEWAQHHVGTVNWSTPIYDLGTFFSVIGTPTIAALTGVPVLWFVWRATGWHGLAFVVLSGSVVFVNMLLKELSGPTPLLLAKFGPDMEGLNYPSGHTVYGVGLFGSLAWLAWAHRRRDIAVVLIVLLLAMGPFRVVSDAHFVSDVVAGYLVGFGWLLCSVLATGAGGTAPSLRLDRAIVRRSG